VTNRRGGPLNVFGDFQTFTLVLYGRAVHCELFLYPSDAAYYNSTVIRIGKIRGQDAYFWVLNIYKVLGVVLSSLEEIIMHNSMFRILG